MCQDKYCPVIRRLVDTIESKDLQFSEHLFIDLFGACIYWEEIYDIWKRRRYKE